MDETAKLKDWDADETKKKELKPGKTTVCPSGFFCSTGPIKSSPARSIRAVGSSNPPLSTFGKGIRRGDFTY